MDEVLENPDRMLEFDDTRYMLKQLEEGVSVFVTHKNHGYDTVYELITQLTDDGDLFDSMDDAVDSIENDVEDERDKTDDIDC